MNALEAIAAQLNTDPIEFVNYMNEDNIGGYHSDPKQAQWHIGSMWAIEARILYAIVRTVKPERILEIGVNYGCSTAHILTALERNGSGILHSVDIDHPKDLSLISDHLHHRWVFHQAEGCAWITRCALTFDMVLEDAGHDYEPTARILRAAKVFLKPRVVMSHDTQHKVVGAWVTQALNDAFGDTWKSYLIEPSDCGLGLWVKDDNT